MSSSTIFSERLLHGYAKELEPIARQIGLPVSFLKDTDVEVDGEKFIEVLNVAAKQLDPLIAFEIGRNLNLGDLGVIGHASASSETVQSLLMIFSKYLFVLSHENHLGLAVGKKQAMVTYSYANKQSWNWHHDEEFAVAIFVNFMRKASGHHIIPNHIDFTHSRPNEYKRYEKYFGCEVKFNQSNARIYLDNKILSYPLITADPSLLKALIFYMDEQLKIRDSEKDSIFKINHLIAIAFNHGEVHIGDIAKQLGMSNRTIQRRLKNAGLSFSSLVEKRRQMLALEYVRSTKYSLTEIALMLGYKEQSSFTRSYKRWTGYKPSEDRNKQQMD